MGKLTKAIQHVREAEATRAKCPVARLRLTLSSEEAAELASALSDKEVTGTQLAKAVADAYGVNIAAQAVMRHRRGDCVCQN